MVSGGQVNGDSNELKSILDNYNNATSELCSNWKGTSYESLSSKFEEFVSEYSSAITSQMSSFATACDLYEQYMTAKKNLEAATNNYNNAVANDDSAAATSYKQDMERYKSQCEKLKAQIESNLSQAATPSLDAGGSSGNASGASVGAKGAGGDASGASAGAQGAGGDASGTQGLGSSSTSSVKSGEYTMDNYPTENNKEDGLERSVLVAEYLVENGGYTKEQAAAIVGVFLDENNCDPTSYMKEEKAGKGAKGTGGTGYGAGIASWTHTDFKNQCLADAGIEPNTPIESLSLQQQSDMVIAMGNNSLKTYYDAVKRCDTIEDASATAVIITGGVGYSKNWDTHPTQAEAKAMSDHYGAVNDARYGASPYHWDLDKRRLDYAKQIYEKME